MRDFFKFVFTGNTEAVDKGVFRNALGVLWGWFKVMIVWIILTGIIIALTGIDTSNSATETMNRLPDMNIWIKFFLISIALPFVEELAFRLSLVPKKKFLPISVPLLIFYLLGGIATLPNMNRTIVLILIFIVMALGVWFVHKKYDVIKDFLTKNRLLWLHFLAISFSLVHWVDYGLVKTPALGVVLLSGALLMGYFFSFIRLRYGFAYAVVAHGFHNGMIILPIIIRAIIN